MSLFKKCMGTFATGITVVTNSDYQGITVNSFCSLSMDPPLILFNLEKKAVRFQLFNGCEDFVVNVLSEEQRDISQAFAHGNYREWQQYFCKSTTSLPILKDILCYIHCLKHHVYDGGDHIIIVGLVQEMKKISSGKPLIYYRGNYHRIQCDEN